MDVPRNDLSMIHRFVPRARRDGRPCFSCTHGRRRERSHATRWPPVAGRGAALAARRILENGMPRFFQRLAEGVFDEADLKLRARELGDFIAEARQRHDLARPIAVGFSNGANIAAR